MSTSKGELEIKDQNLLKLSADQIAHLWSSQVKAHLERAENDVNKNAESWQPSGQLLVTTTVDSFLLSLETTIKNNHQPLLSTQLINLKEDLANVLRLLQQTITESALPPNKFAAQNRSLQQASLLALYSSTLPGQESTTNSLSQEAFRMAN